jgi:hypothetical protein
MGQLQSRSQRAGVTSTMPPRPATGGLSRETASLAEKEDAAEMAFMTHTMHIKQWAAEEGRLAHVLAREDNTAQPYSYDPLTLPLDEEGFVETVAADDTDGIREFFERYGLVVIRDAVDDAACVASRNELWDFIERQLPERDGQAAVRRDRPETWERWPSLSGLGILGNTFNLGPQLCANRQSVAVHRAFAALFETDQLRVNIGRSSVMRPTVNVPWPQPNGSSVPTDKPEWRSKAGEEWLHWDMNPFTGASSSFSWYLKDAQANHGYDRLSVQGILAVSDCGPDDGGFFCCPGSHRAVRGWANRHGAAVPDSKILSPESSCQIYLSAAPDDEIRQNAQRAPIRAGSLLIWDARLAHCNYPNASSNLRMVQYIQMIRADDPAFAPLIVDEGLLPPREQLELTHLGRRLYGLEDWPSERS